MTTRAMLANGSAVVFGLLLAASVCPGAQVIHQDGFETDPAARGWQAAAPPTRTWASGIANTGKRSLRIYIAPGQNVKWGQNCAIPVKQDIKYRVSVWVKCSNVLDHWGVNFEVSLPGGEGTSQGWLCGTDGWREFYRYFTPRTSTIISGFRLGLAGENDLDWGHELGNMTAWFDDLTVTQTDLDMSTVPVASGVETRGYSNQAWWERLSHS